MEHIENLRPIVQNYTQFGASLYMDDGFLVGFIRIAPPLLFCLLQLDQMIQMGSITWQNIMHAVISMFAVCVIFIQNMSCVVIASLAIMSTSIGKCRCCRQQRLHLWFRRARLLVAVVGGPDEHFDGVRCDGHRPKCRLYGTHCVAFISRISRCVRRVRRSSITLPAEITLSRIDNPHMVEQMSAATERTLHAVGMPSVQAGISTLLTVLPLGFIPLGMCHVRIVLST